MGVGATRSYSAVKWGVVLAIYQVKWEIVKAAITWYVRNLTYTL